MVAEAAAEAACAAAPAAAPYGEYQKEIPTFIFQGPFESNLGPNVYIPEASWSTSFFFTFENSDLQVMYLKILIVCKNLREHNLLVPLGLGRLNIQLKL